MSRAGPARLYKCFFPSAARKLLLSTRYAISRSAVTIKLGFPT